MLGLLLSVKSAGLDSECELLGGDAEAVRNVCVSEVGAVPFRCVWDTGGCWGCKDGRAPPGLSVCLLAASRGSI